MQKDQGYYKSIKNEAEAGDPHAMLQVAKLYKSRVFQDESDEEYIFWLKQFFASPVVDALLTTLDADEDGDFTDEFFRSQKIVDAIGFEAEGVLQADIIEAGVSLGLYFKNSCEKEELFCARDSLYAAWLASRFDYMEIPEAGGVTDVLSILTAINKRIEDFGYVEGI